MKNLLATFFLSVIACACFCSVANADVIYSLDFESGPGVGYTTSNGEHTDGVDDYFFRTNGGDLPGDIVYIGAQGFFFAAQDIDDGGNFPTTQSLFISGLDISGFTDLTIDLWAAEDTDGSSEDWDELDGFQVFATVDNGTQFQIFGIEAGGDRSNAAPFVDTNFDGFGDGAPITDVFQNFQAGIFATGSSLDLEFRFSLNAADEDLAIDNIVVQGTASAIPEPGSVGLIVLLAGVAVTRRRR